MPAKRFLNTHLEFAYYFFFLSYSFGIETTKTASSSLYPISDQNGQILYPFSDLSGAKTLPCWSAHTYMAYIREYSPPGCTASRCVTKIRDLTKPRRRRQRKRQKTIGLMSKTTTLHVHHAFLYISLPSLYNYDVKCPNFKFTWERERQGDKFYHLCPNLSAFPSLQLQPKSPSFK